MTCHSWEPISDLPVNWGDLASEELLALRNAWQESRNRMESQDSLNSFHERLAREWAIETGFIERVYDIDRGTTLLLIEKGIEASLIPHGATNKPAELVVAIIRDHKEALEGLFDFVRDRRSLSISYVKELHQLLMRHQNTTVAREQLTGKLRNIELVKGDWKRWPNNPYREDGELLHEYCPPEQVASEMDRLIEMHVAHMQQNIPPEIEAAWLHHRFAQIHPFQDGNGRVARAISSLILIKDGCFPLVIHRDVRDQYLTALEKADHNDLAPFVALISLSQVKMFRRALSISEDVLLESRADIQRRVIESAIERLNARRMQEEMTLKQVFDIAKSLEELALEELQATATSLDASLKAVSDEYFANARRNDRENSFWYTGNVVELAGDPNLAYQYFADTRTYHSWIRLRIRESRQAEFVVSFHCLGTKFNGIMVASAFLLIRHPKDDDANPRIDGPYPVMPDDLFQFSHNERIENVTRRFRTWLEQVVLIALEQWRKQL